MSSLLIQNGHLVTLDEENTCIPNGSVYVEETKIVEVGEIPAGKYTPDKTIDAGGNVVMPGLIIAHHHLYSTLARGFCPPGEPASNFKEILERLWWKLDAALDEDDVYYSALIAILNAARAGCTTIVDHHASPACVDGSLDLIERAFREVGLSGCLCYEVSDRNREGEGIEENERFIRKCRASDDDQVSPLLGLHALLTLGNPTLERCAAITRDLGVGVHVHVAESEHDMEETRQAHGCGVMDRFLEFGMPGEGSIFVHGVHFKEPEIEVLRDSNSMMVTNPESNMNNAVGVTPVPELLKSGVLLGLGTDGMSSHIISQARALYMVHRVLQHDPRVMFVEAAEMLLQNNRTIAGRLFREPRGALVPGQLADIMIPDYVPFTPLTGNTLYGHLLFGLGFARVNTTVARGRVVVEDGVVPGIDEAAIRARCVERAERLWARIQ